MAYSNLGIALSKAGAADEAKAAYRKSISLSPENMMTLVNFANSLAGSGEMDEATAVSRKVIDIAPGYSGGYLVLGSVLRDAAQLDESLAAFDRAIELDSHSASAHSGRIFARHFHSGSDAAALQQDQKLWDERHGLPLTKQIKPHQNDRNAGRRIKVGYVSPDFKSHVLALTLMPIFSTHDKSQFEVYIYSRA